MFFPQNISELRQFYLDAWHKLQEKQPLSLLEQQISEVLVQHPEYHAWLKEENLELNFHPDVQGENPFLHMGLHLAIQDQLKTDRPKGIRDIYFSFSQKNSHLSAHQIEHVFMNVLAKNLWLAQDSGQAPNETKYLEDCCHLIA